MSNSAPRRTRPSLNLLLRTQQKKSKGVNTDCSVRKCVTGESEEDKLTTCISSQECAICLKDMTHNQVLSTTHCGHTFHKSCLQQWDDFCIGKPYQCPLCRATLDSKHKKKVLEAEPIDEFQFVQILQNLDDDETEIASLLMTIINVQGDVRRILRRHRDSSMLENEQTL